MKNVPSLGITSPSQALLEAVELRIRARRYWREEPAIVAMAEKAVVELLPEDYQVYNRWVWASLTEKERAEMEALIGRPLSLPQQS